MKRPKKDPNAPKRAFNAYLFFVRDKRDELRRQNPDASIGQLTGMMGKKWKEMSEAEKAPYTKQSEEDKARYLKEKQEYEARQRNRKEDADQYNSSSEGEEKPKVRVASFYALRLALDR